MAAPAPAAPVVTTPAQAMPHAVDSEKTAVSLDSSLSRYFSALDPIVRPVADVFAKMGDIRRSLNLPNLGKIERLQNEVKGTQICLPH